MNGLVERINLVPRPPLALRIRQTVRLWCVLLVVIGSCVVYVMGLMLASENSKLTGAVRLLEAQQTTMLQQQTFVTTAQAETRRLRQENVDLGREVDRLLQLPDLKKHYSGLLLTVSRLLPDTVRCDRLVLSDTGGVLEGRASSYRDLPAFVDQLGRQSLLSNVQLRTLSQNFSGNFSQNVGGRGEDAKRDTASDTPTNTARDADGQLVFTISFTIHSPAY